MREQLTLKYYKHPDVKYKFIRKLGDGSASKIYISENKETGEKVIIKCINKKDEWKSEYNVLNTLKDLNSNRLLKLLDVYETYRFVYIVTEFYDGKDLFDHIDLNVPYPENFAKQMIKEMAVCIKKCHDINIAHLDIKCENYMVDKMTPNPKFILIDFGHAEKIDNTIKKGYSKYGTSFYLCPEGYDKIFSKKSDIWSLGICTHLILSGDYPFNGDSTEYFRSGKLNIDKSLSNSAIKFIIRCLEFDPKDRYTIDEVIESSYLNVSI
jgi:serine/threonine protein kinase